MNSQLTYSDWDALDSRLIWAYTDRVLPQYRNAWMDDYGTISARCYINGTAQYLWRKKMYLVKPGEWFFAPDSVYHQRVSDDAQHHSIRFRIHWITGESLFDHSQPLIVSPKDSNPINLAGVALCQRIHEQFPESRNHFQGISADADFYFEISECFRTWVRAYFSTLSRLSTPMRLISNIDPRVRRGISYIDEHLKDSLLCSTLVAQAAGCSSSNFAKIFRDETEKSIGQFIALRRKQRVIEAVQVEGMSIKEAAYSVGFRSLSHFSRWFKAQTGKSPRQYFYSVNADQ